jgi:predicted MFS family arabinose efflux permease
LKRFADLLGKYPDFRRLFWAMVISMVGDWFAFVAVAGFVTEVTGHQGLPAFLYAASVLPVFLLSPVAGVVADRFDRRRVMILADLIRVPVALGLCVAVWRGSPWLAFACMLLLAVLSTFFDPVAAAVVPNLVDAEDLAMAQGASNAAWGAMLMVGAGLGGLVTALLGRQLSFVINAATFLLSALLVARIRRPLQTFTPGRRSGFVQQLSAVRELVRKRPVLAPLILTKCGVGSANGIVGLLPGLALGKFGSGDGGVGLLLGARGLGALLGPLLASRLLGGRGGRGLLLVCGVSTISYGAAYAFLPVVPSLALAAGCVMLAHLGGGAQWALSTYGIQRITPDEIRGRVMSLDFGIATLAIGASALVAGMLAEVVGLTATTWWMVGVAITFGVGWLAATRKYWRAGSPDPLLLGPETAP